jgi:hypothetical protein
MTPTCTLRKALSDKKLLGSILAGDSWLPWRVLLLAAMGEELTEPERVIYRELTKRDHEPVERVEEFIAVIGRRGGKSRAISVLATYLAGLVRYPLVKGETGVLLIIAPDQKQASIVLDYVEANFKSSPILAQLVQSRNSDTISLTNKISIEVRAANFRRLRGPTFCAVIVDEVAYFFSDETNSSNPDTEILGAVRPGLATTNGPLFMISSPYARRGELWRSYDTYYGKPGPILVAQAETRVMNAQLPSGVITRAYERDPVAASAEYGAQFRSDIESYINIEAVRACMPSGIYERPRQWGAYQYQAFCDPAGGSGSDSMTLAIGHNEPQRETAVLDCLREVRPNFSPEVVVAEFAEVLKSYGLTTVIGDKFAGGWVAEQFGKVGIVYKAIAEPKSQLYSTLLAIINSRRCDLLDNKRLLSQLTALERRTSRGGGRDVIDHLPGGHDDVANCVAGVITHLLTKGKFNFWALADMSPNQQPGKDKEPQQQTMEEWRRLRRNLYYESGGTIRL